MGNRTRDFIPTSEMGELLVKYTEDDIGEVKDIDDNKGSFYDERIVMVYCSICGSKYIGPIHEAGGFLARHDFYHKWEFTIEMNNELEA